MKFLKTDFPLTLPAVLMALSALFILGRMAFTGEQAGTYALWLLALCLSVPVLKKGNPPRRSGADAYFPWLLLGLSAAAAVFSPRIGIYWSIWIASGAVYAYAGGTLLALKLALPNFILFILLSSMDYLHLLLSSPLSKICAALTVLLLQAVGVECSLDQAVIFTGKDHVAVTAACSGVELLEAMLLLGWFVVYFEHRNFWMRLLHYLTLLPAILLANTLRLTVVILLSFRIGERAFHDPVHSLLGYCVVISAMLLLFLTGKLFKQEETEEPQ